MTESLQDKVAFVTGAARGIGRAIALALAGSGASVVVADLHPEPFRGERYHRLRERWSGDDEAVATADAVRGLGRKAFTVTVDVSDRASVEAAARSANDALGAPDILPAMVGRGWGRVINIASIAAERPGLGQAGYSASKAGLLGLTRSVAQEFGPSGITCNAILPGLIGTPLVRSMPAHLRDAIVSSTPVGRLGEPEDIGNLAAFLASPEASFICAVGIPCDGGFSNAPLRGLNR